MLTFNLPKDQIKVFVNKICKNSAQFPDNFLNDLLVSYNFELIDVLEQN